MATERHNTLVLTPQTPGGEALTSLAGRLRSDCPTAADVRARAAVVRAWRDRVWPSQSPRRPPAPLPAAPQPAAPIAVLAPVLLEPQPPGRITVRRVLDATAAHFGTTPEVLRSGRRTQPLTRRRQVAMYVARRFTGRSLWFIARGVGRKDHTTVLHATRVVKQLLDAGDRETIEAVNGITERLQLGGANV